MYNEYKMKMNLEMENSNYLCYVYNYVTQHANLHSVVGKIVLSENHDDKQIAILFCIIIYQTAYMCCTIYLKTPHLSFVYHYDQREDRFNDKEIHFYTY